MTPHDAEHTPARVRHHPLGDGGVILRDFEFFHFGIFKNDLIGTADGNAKHGRLFFRFPLWFRFYVLLGKRRFPHDFRRFFVRAQPLETRLPQHVFVRPFGKLHLCDQTGFQKNRFRFVKFGRGFKRRYFRAQLVEFFQQRLRIPLPEPRSRAPRENQFSAFVHPEQKRADPARFFLRDLITADHEFLTVIAFHFDPIAVSRSTVPRIEFFADNAFQTDFCSGLKDLLSVAERVFAVNDGCGRALHQFFKRAFSLGKREIAQIFAVGRQQVKDDERQFFSRRLFQIVLQRLKIALSVFVRYDHFPVEYHRAPLAPRFQRLRNAFEFRRIIVAAARHQFHGAVLRVRQYAVAVVLDLVSPAIFLRKFIYGSREMHGNVLKRNDFRLRRFLRRDLL